MVAVIMNDVLGPGKGCNYFGVRFCARSPPVLSLHPNKSLQLGRSVPISQVEKCVRWWCYFSHLYESSIRMARD